MEKWNWNETFTGCKKLKTVVLKEGVKELGEYVFTQLPETEKCDGSQRHKKSLVCTYDSIFYYRGLKCNLSKHYHKNAKELRNV